MPTPNSPPGACTSPLVRRRPAGGCRSLRAPGCARTDGVHCRRCTQNPYAPQAARAFTPPVAFDPPDVGQAYVSDGDADTWQATALDVLCSKSVTSALYLRDLANPVGVAWSPLSPATGSCLLAVLTTDFRVRLFQAPKGLDLAWQQVQDLADGLLARRRQVDWVNSAVRRLDCCFAVSERH